MTRHFEFWCESCPTRIKVETDVPGDSVWPKPEYNGESEGVGLALARKPIEGDDGMVIASFCPADGGQLHCLDDLIGRGHIPYSFGGPSDDSPSLHAEWIAKRKTEKKS